MNRRGFLGTLAAGFAAAVAHPLNGLPDRRGHNSGRWGQAEAELARFYGAGIFGLGPADKLKLQLNMNAVWAGE